MPGGGNHPGCPRQHRNGPDQSDRPTPPGPSTRVRRADHLLLPRRDSEIGRGHRPPQRNKATAPQAIVLPIGQNERNMAARRPTANSEDQLELFAPNPAAYEHSDSIRVDGRKTLARTLPEPGTGAGDTGPAPADASGSGGENRGRNVGVAPTTDETGTDRAAGPRPGLGDGAGEIQSPA